MIFIVDFDIGYTKIGSSNICNGYWFFIDAIGEHAAVVNVAR